MNLPVAGNYVRFAPLPETCKPRPLRVTAVTPNGMLKFEGHEGVYAPQLFVVVEKPHEAARECRRRHH